MKATVHLVLLRPAAVPARLAEIARLAVVVVLLAAVESVSWADADK